LPARDVAASLCPMNKLPIWVLVGALAGCGGGTKADDDGFVNNGDGGCLNDFSCDLGSFCIEGECLPLGDECAQDDDCGLGRVCRSGYCVEFVPECAEHTDCADGFVCVEEVCVEGCRDDDGCASEEVCDPASHSCVDAAPNNGLPCGGACPDHRRCDTDSQECVPDGTCAEDDHCVGENVCTEGVCRPPETPCAGNTDCAPSTFCDRDAMRCAPGCRQSNECRIEEVCVLGQCTDPPECLADDNEPNDLPDQATPVGDGDRFEDLTICEEDDWFSFIAFAGDEVRVEATFIHDFGNINLQLFRPDGELFQQVAGNVDSERIDLELPDTGLYTVRVHAGGRGVFTRYDLAFDITRNCTDDDFEPNDQVEEATVLEPGAHEDRRICGDNDDWYAVQLYAGETMTATIDFAGSLGDLDLELYDAEHDLIEAAETDGDQESIEYVAAAPQMVFLRIPGDEALINGYDLTVDAQSPACEPDDLEEDDLSEEASAVAPGDEIAGTLCASDSDWFTLVLPADVPLELTLDFDHAVGDLNLYVFDADGETLVASSESETDHEEIDFLVDTPGRFFVQVAGTGRAQAAYTLHIDGGGTVACPGDDRFEENDLLSQSAPLNPPGRHGDVIMCDGDDDDWYRFQLTEGHSAEVYVLYQAEDGQLEVDLLGPDAVRDDDAPFHSVVGTAPTKRVRASLGADPGTWKVRVRRVDGTAVPYAIRLFIYEGPLPLTCEFDDEFEPDDEALDATRIQPGTPYNAIVCGDDTDWYRVDAEAGEIINIRVDFLHVEGNIDAGLHRGNPLRPVVSANSTTDNEFLRFQATSDGPLFVEVTHDGETGNLYSVLLTRLEGPEAQSCQFDDRFEQNDDYGSAPVTEPGIHTAIRCGDDDDFFGVDLVAGQLLRATLAWEGDVSLDLGLVGPGNTVVATADDSELPARQLLFTAPSDGRFALAVTGDDADTLYTLRFEVLDVEPEPCGSLDENEPNNSVLDATAVTEDQVWTELSLCGADEDWFRVTVPRRASLLVQAGFDAQAGNVEIEAFRENGGAYAASYGPGDAERLLLESGNEETVFLVRTFVRGATQIPVAYELGFLYADVASCGPDDNEPNESRNGATRIRAGSFEGLTLCPEDVDWFQIETLPFQTVTATISFDHDEHNLGMTLYDPNLQLEAARSDTTGNSETVTWLSLLGGPIQIQVFGAGGNGTGYSMTVRLQ
jgi:hypothetical protein